MSSNKGTQSEIDFAQRVRINQQRLRSNLKSEYDFIVCGSGSSGSVVARRLAENPHVSVLLLEAGGDDDVPSVTEANRWFENLRTERAWEFVAQPNPHLNGRCMSLPMGKVLGEGSSINAMTWARGHKKAGGLLQNDGMGVLRPSGGANAVARCWATNLPQAGF